MKYIHNLIRDVYPTVFSNVDTLNVRYTNIKTEVEWIKKVMNYNIHKGKFLPALFILSYLSSEIPEHLTKEDIKTMIMHGLCLEMVSNKRSYRILKN